MHDGQRTEYVIDPTELSKVVAEYDDSGLVARFTHGLGLTSRIDSLGDSAYYDFDALGTTSGISGDAGQYINSYTTLPFGEVVEANEAISNPYQFGGQLGVMHEENGLTFMRARYYDAQTGRFISPDPLGASAGDVNLYRYAANSPTAAVDPEGTFLVVGGAAGALVGGAIGAAGYGISSLVGGGEFTWGGLAGATVSGGLYGAVVGATGGLACISSPVLAGIGMSAIGGATNVVGYGIDSVANGKGTHVGRGR